MQKKAAPPNLNDAKFLLFPGQPISIALVKLNGGLHLSIYYFSLLPLSRRRCGKKPLDEMRPTQPFSSSSSLLSNFALFLRPS